MENSVTSRIKIISFIAAIAVMALLWGLWSQHNLASSKKNQQLVLNSGTVLSQPQSIKPFHLMATKNKLFTNHDFKNQWTLVFFGFTHCPQVCPTTMSVLNQTYKQLQLDQVAQLPQVVFITVDPERDSIKKLKEYVTSFNPKFIGARGEDKKINELTKQFNVVYAKAISTNKPENYSIDHSGAILLIDPQGKWYALFSMPHDAKQLASDYEKIIATAKTTIVQTKL